MYSTWAARRRNVTLFWLSAIGVIGLAVYLLISMYEPPSCFDKKFNQDEVAIDCGGVCARMCSSQIGQLSVAWTSSFEVSQGMWSAFAYIDNPNTEAYAPLSKYRFTLYDRAGEVITEVDGETIISRNPMLPVFEGRIQVGDRVPYRTEFVWLDEEQVWYKEKNFYEVIVQEQVMKNASTKPEIQATVLNKTPYVITDVEVFVIVYDIHKNAIATSKTYVDSLSPRGKRNITFSWPNPFGVQYERMELIVQVPQQED